jgi:hypothetical protein
MFQENEDGWNQVPVDATFVNLFGKDLDIVENSPEILLQASKETLLEANVGKTTHVYNIHIHN